MTRLKRVAIALLAAFALLFAAYGGLIWFYPLQAFAWNQRIDLWRSGVHEKSVAGLHLYERNYCGGSGTECRCIALLHGLGDEALTWNKILQRKAGDWYGPVRVFAFDLPGSGESPAPANLADYSARGQARIVSGALAQVPGCDRWMVVGNSLGGMISAWIGIEGLATVNKLVLVNSAGLKESRGSPAVSELANPTASSLKDFLALAYAHPHPYPAHMLKAAAAKLAESNVRTVLAAQRPADELDTELPKLHKPVMIFWGAADRIIPREQGRKMARMIPLAAYREAPDCGHMPQKECPLALMTALNEMLRFGSM